MPTEPESEITGLTTDLAGKENTVVHGATAGTARPAGATVVHWIGSVQPTNAATNDEWTDTTNKVVNRYNGSTWDALGAGGSSLPTQTGNGGKALVTNGTTAAWLLARGALPQAAMSGAVAETIDRGMVNLANNALTTTQTVGMAVYLRAGTVITAGNFINFVSVGSMTHLWFALTDVSFNVVAVTADDTSGTWAVGGTKTINFTAPYTVPTSGVYYFCVGVVATTAPSIPQFPVGSGGQFTPYPCITVSSTSTPPTVGATLAASNGSRVYWGWLT